MSRSAIIGSFGIGHQSAKGTASSSFSFLPTQSIGLQPNQNAQGLPMEIGGAYVKRGSFKSMVQGGGDVGLIPRANSFGNLLLGLTGSDTVTNVTGLSGIAYQHVFTPFAPAGNATSVTDLPWFTLAKDISKMMAEVYTDSKVRGLRVSVPKGSIVTAQSSFMAITPSTNTSASLGTETLDSSPFFQAAVATLSLVKESDGSTISTNAGRAENITMDFTNTLSEDEGEIGSYYLADLTLLSRAITCNLQTVVRDPALYQAVYQNGGTIPGSWSPTIYRGTLNVTLVSTTPMPGTVGVGGYTNGLPYSLQFTFPGLDFQAYPIEMQGNDLLRAALSTEVTLGPSGTDQYSMTLINTVASY